MAANQMTITALAVCAALFCADVGYKAMTAANLAAIQEMNE